MQATDLRRFVVVGNCRLTILSPLGSRLAEIEQFLRETSLGPLGNSLQAGNFCELWRFFKIISVEMSEAEVDDLQWCENC